ncbi:MAG TPA: hypothetical protein VM942_01180 [Acidimicrobiales bacterium]|nr:hypothetical protein [Acidimicrobiales bacterium]
MNGPMGGPMGGVDELERRLSERLQGHGRMAPDGDGWQGILERIEQRGRARHRRRAAATGLVAVGIVGSLVVVSGDDTTRVRTTSAPPATAPPAGTSEFAAAAALPHLVLDVPGFELIGASADVTGGPEPDIGPLLVYAVPGDGLVGPGPAMFARLVPAGTSYGIGDGAEVKEVDVAGRPGRLLSPDGAAAVSLGWQREDGSIVHLIAVGVADEDVAAAGTAMEEALVREQAPPATLPGTFELRRATPPEATASSLAEVVYAARERHVQLRLTSGTTYRLDSLVLDRLASSGSWRPAVVDGKSGVMATYQDVGDAAGAARTLMWAFSDGVVAELTAQGLTEAEMEAAAASIREVDDAEWNELLARFVERPSGPEEAAGEDPLRDLTIEICHLRDRWLAAHAVGTQGRPVEAGVVGQLESVIEKGRAAGLGDRSDILVVAERLGAAMAAGDAAAVSSIPEGGACS